MRMKSQDHNMISEIFSMIFKPEMKISAMLDESICKNDSALILMIWVIITKQMKKEHQLAYVKDNGIRTTDHVMFLLMDIPTHGGTVHRETKICGHKTQQNVTCGRWHRNGGGINHEIDQDNSEWSYKRYSTVQNILS